MIKDLMVLQLGLQLDFGLIRLLVPQQDFESDHPHSSKKSYNPPERSSGGFKRKRPKS